jgi:hypothetical protein
MNQHFPKVQMTYWYVVPMNYHDNQVSYIESVMDVNESVHIESKRNISHIRLSHEVHYIGYTMNPHHDAYFVV